MTQLLRMTLFLAFFIPALGLAQVQLLSVQQSYQGPKIIIPLLKNESATAAIERYQETLQSRDLENISIKGLKLKIYKYEILPSGLVAQGRIRAALIANWFSDLLPGNSRMARNIQLFSQKGADTYVMALAADFGLSTKDAQDFRKEVAEKFNLLVSLGGDDIDPLLYGEENRFAGKVNYARDRSEFELVKAFKNRGRGVFFGICRGHQMGAVADGHSLYQDLTKENIGTTDHHVNLEGTDSTSSQRWHHIFLEDSLLKRLLGGRESVRVNSLHHQAVRPSAEANSVVIALDDRDNIVEALQGKNGKSLSVQFHPEFPESVSGDKKFSSMGSDLITGIVRYARLIRTLQSGQGLRCHKIY